MTDEEKKLLQAKHRLEEAQARDRVKERKERTRRLIQEGAILEKVFPWVNDVTDLSELEKKLGQELRSGKRQNPLSQFIITAPTFQKNAFMNTAPTFAEAVIKMNTAPT